MLNGILLNLTYSESVREIPDRELVIPDGRVAVRRNITPPAFSVTRYLLTALQPWLASSPQSCPIRPCFSESYQMGFFVKCQMFELWHSTWNTEAAGLDEHWRGFSNVNPRSWPKSMLLQASVFCFAQGCFYFGMVTSSLFFRWASRATSACPSKENRLRIGAGWETAEKWRNYGRKFGSGSHLRALKWDGVLRRAEIVLAPGVNFPLI